MPAICRLLWRTAVLLPLAGLQLWREVGAQNQQQRLQQHGEYEADEAAHKLLQSLHHATSEHDISMMLLGMLST